MSFCLPFLKELPLLQSARRAAISAFSAGLLLLTVFPLQAGDQSGGEEDDDFLSWFFASEGEDRDAFGEAEAGEGKSFEKFSDVYKWLFGKKDAEEEQVPPAPVLQPTLPTDSDPEKASPGEPINIFAPGDTVWDHIADDADWRAYRLPSQRGEKFDLYLWFITDLPIRRMETYWHLKQAEGAKAPGG